MLTADGQDSATGDATPLVDTLPEPVDQAVLAGLRDLQVEGEPDVVAEFIAVFLDEAPPLLTAIRTGVTEGNAETVKRAAHTLRSGSANLGAHQMAGLCAELEKRGRSGMVEGSEVVLAQLEGEWLRVAAALTAEQERA
jgi:HPt (histidine-containing phosphotransfer) domain-containing protein